MKLVKKFYDIKKINDHEVLDIKFRDEKTKDNYNVILKLTIDNAKKAEELKDIEIEESDIKKSKVHNNNFGVFNYHQIKSSVMEKYGFDVPSHLENVISRINEINTKKQAG